MSKNITVTISTKEAVELLSLGGSVSKKVLKALQATKVYPVGKTASAVAQAKRSSKKVTSATTDNSAVA